MSTKTKKGKPHLLVIEDDPDIATLLVYNLEREGYEVEAADDGQAGLSRAECHPPDLIILDLMLPTLDGLEVCRRLRSSIHTREIPILMLTAKSEEIDEIVGFSVGADDYVTKPFSIKVLAQRVHVLLTRRKQTGEVAEKLEMHGIVVDRIGHEVFCNGSPLFLTPTEFRLLEALMRQPGRAFSRGDLLNAAVGDETIVLERTIDVHVRSLRQKLGPQAGVIETVRGVGYRFAREMREFSEHGSAPQ